MKYESFCIAGSAVLCLAWLCCPAGSSAAKNTNLSINAEGDPARCSDLKVTSNGQIARSEESFTLQRNEAPTLEIEDAAGRGALHVRGWDRQQYAVEVCKIAAAEDRAGADQLLRGIGVSRSAGRFSTTGPGGEGSWQTYFIVHAPKDGSVDLQTKNGPIDVAGITGVVKARAGNGPISLKDCGGQVEAHTTNGPISFSGQGGEVHLQAQNGPISVSLSGDVWNGPALEARAVNGPVSLSIPETFRSGVRVETSHGPVSCGAAACRTAWKDPQRSMMQLNGSQDTIRISTENGPVSVGSKKSGRVI